MIEMTVRSTADLLAAVPVVLGFHPTDSVVMLTFGGRRDFHARIDLPPASQLPDCLEEFTAMLLLPAVRQRAVSVYLIYYAGSAKRARKVHRHVASACAQAQIQVIDGIRVDRDQWFPVQGTTAAGQHGTPFDAAGHPFTAEAVGAGMVTAASRDELAARLEARPAPVAAVRAAIEGGAVRRLDPGQARDLVEAHLGAGTDPSAEEAAAILLAIQDRDGRRAAWWGVGGERAALLLEWWLRLLQRAPEELAGPASSVLAAVSWMAGHGAMAWCALQRGQDAGPVDELAALVQDLLLGAVPPISDWADLVQEVAGHRPASTRSFTQ